MKSLKDNTSIEYIDLSANNITEKGVKYLVESNWYQRQEKLIPVLLSSNIIGDDGVKNLVNYFEEALAHSSHNKRLCSINLASNKISSRSKNDC